MNTEPDLADLLEQRRAIDRALQEKHQQTMTVLFTDIVGSTAFFEQRGDVEGLALVHRHNDLLFPLVGAHRGRIVKTIGDAIMAVYDDAHDAVRSAIAMQNALADEAKGSGKEPIHIRIGLHTGTVLKDKDDVFGDTVNVAARVNSACAPDEILATDATKAAISGDVGKGGIVWQERDDIAAKGKAAPVPAFAVPWRDDDKNDARAAQAAQKLFMLSITRGPDGVRVSALDGDTGKGTLSRHTDLTTTTASLDALTNEVRVLCHNGGQNAYQQALRDKGRALAEAVLPPRIREQLSTTPHRALRLHLDDATAHLPFELAQLGVGDEPIGSTFAVGRIVSAKDVTGAEENRATIGAEVVVLADLDGSLPAAHKEGDLVAALYADIGAVVQRRIGAQTRAQVLDVVRNANIIHIAAHLDKNSYGIVCSDGVVTAHDLKEAFAQHVPGLIVANACHASLDAPWATATFTRGLLNAGVSHVVAPLWAVPDQDGLAFALRFTESALTGVGTGEAVRRARGALREHSAGPLAYAGYVLFGDPRSPLPLPLSVPKMENVGRTSA